MNTPLVLLILVTLLCLFFQRSKLITCLTFFFIWTLSWTESQPDYSNYHTMYFDETSTDIGYAWITLLGNTVGWDYFTFRLVFLGVGWIIYAWFIIKFSKRCALISVIYLWTLSVYDMVQNRNFVAFAICLIGISLLFRNQSLKNQFCFFIIILIASSIHVTCAFFLLFLVLNKNILERLSKFQIFISSVICAIILLFFFTQQILYKIDNYDTGVSTLTKTLLLLLFITNIVFIYYVKRFRTWDKWIEKLSYSQRSYSFINKDTIWKYNVALLLLLPASFMSLSALRIFKYSGLLNVCYASNRLETHYFFNNVFLTLLLIVYSGSFSLVSYMMHALSFLHVVMPPFYDNIFY